MNDDLKNKIQLTIDSILFGETRAETTTIFNQKTIKITTYKVAKVIRIDIKGLLE